MTSPKIDKEITATARQIVKTIDDQARITLHLSSLGRKIQERLDTPESDDPVTLKILANGTSAGACLIETRADRIRYLSYQLRTLLDQEEDKND